MTESEKKYLADIIRAIELIEDFTAEIMDFLDYQVDLKTKSAVERQLGIVGEAVNKFRQHAGSVTFSHTRQVVDFRNRLIHSYDNLDDAIVWVILNKHLPVLKKEAETALLEG